MNRDHIGAWEDAHAAYVTAQAVFTWQGRAASLSPLRAAEESYQNAREGFLGLFRPYPGLSLADRRLDLLEWRHAKLVQLEMFLEVMDTPGLERRRAKQAKRYMAQKERFLEACDPASDEKRTRE